MMDRCEQRGHHAFNLDNSNVIANDYHEETVKIICAVCGAEAYLVGKWNVPEQGKTH